MPEAGDVPVAVENVKQALLALSRSLVGLDEDSMLVALVEMSQTSWFVVGLRPGVGKHPGKAAGIFGPSLGGGGGPG